MFHQVAMMEKVRELCKRDERVVAALMASYNEAEAFSFWLFRLSKPKRRTDERTRTADLLITGELFIRRRGGSRPVFSLQTFRHSNLPSSAQRASPSLRRQVLRGTQAGEGL